MTGTTAPPTLQFACSPQQLSAVQLLLDGNSTAANLVCTSFNVTVHGAVGAVLAWTIKGQTQLETNWDGTSEGLDISFVLVSTYIIFMMQAGFALYTAGLIRQRNIAFSLLKNLADAIIAGLMFFVVGYAFAYGHRTHGDGAARNAGVRADKGNGFIGTWNFALKDADGSPHIWANFMFQWSFCSAAATIISGAIAERATLWAYTVYTAMFSAWIYPVLVHWLWSESGWLSAHNPSPVVFNGAIDFAGSGVVHALAGWASLIGAHFVGKRASDNPDEFKTNRSASNYVLGTMLLWFGWYGFNPGSVQMISNKDSSEIVARTAVVTTLGGVAGAITAGLASILFGDMDEDWYLLRWCSGLLSGLVAITGGCAVVPPWAAIIIGGLSAMVYIFMEALVEKCAFPDDTNGRSITSRLAKITWIKRLLGIDDPVQAFAMHGCCGAFGLLMVAAFADQEYVRQVYNIENYGHGMKLLAAQAVAAIVIILWSVSWATVIFSILHLARWNGASVLRVRREIQMRGVIRDALRDVMNIDIRSRNQQDKSQRQLQQEAEA